MNKYVGYRQKGATIVKLMFIDNITVGMMVGKDIGIVDGPDGKVPLVREKTVLTLSLLDLMREHNVRFAYIMEPRERALAEMDVQRDIYIPQYKPAINSRLRDAAVKNLEDLFALVKIGAEDINENARIVKDLNKLIEQVVSSLEEDEHALVNIINLKSYDDYTYHHSISVAVLSIATAQHMGFDRQAVRRLAKCAMMHDIGKTSVPVEIINKPGKLTESEFDVVKKHSPDGYHFLSDKIIGDEEIWDGVLFHHERMDGHGYPRGLRSNDIPLWSKILSVADVYDALTSNRPYRQPMQPAEALEYIMGGVGTAFDYDVVSSFIRKLELYPLGSKIKLSNGRTAVIYNNENTMRPVVRLLPTGEILDLHRDRSTFNLIITQLLPN